MGEISEGDKIPTKIGSGRVEMANPRSSQMSGWIRIGQLDFLNFRGKLGKVEDNPEFSQFLAKVEENRDIPTLHDF